MRWTVDWSLVAMIWEEGLLDGRTGCRLMFSGGAHMSFQPDQMTYDEALVAKRLGHLSYFKRGGGE